MISIFMVPFNNSRGEVSFSHSLSTASFFFFKLNIIFHENFITSFNLGDDAISGEAVRLCYNMQQEAVESKHLVKVEKDVILFNC